MIPVLIGHCIHSSHNLNGGINSIGEQYHHGNLCLVNHSSNQLRIKFLDILQAISADPLFNVQVHILGQISCTHLGQVHPCILVASFSHSLVLQYDNHIGTLAGPDTFTSRTQLPQNVHDPSLFFN